MHTDENAIFAAVLTILGVIGIIAGYFLVSQIRMHNAYAARLDDMNKSRLSSLDAERRMIVANLHDEIITSLSIARLRLDDVVAASELGRKQLLISRDHIDMVLRQSRSLIQQTNAPYLFKTDPLHAIEKSIRDLSEKTALNIRVLRSVEFELQPEDSMHVYLMLQEIIQNTIKHAKATLLLITAKTENDTLVIETIDDGIGFDPMKLYHTGTGLGLENISIRAKQLHARFSLNSSPGKGTDYQIEIPLKTNS